MPTAAARSKGRSVLQRERDLQRIEEMHLKGFTQAEIAERTGVAKRLVIYDLQTLAQRYTKATQERGQKHISSQLRKIDLLEREAWAAWERSKQQREITTKRRKSSAGEKGDQTTNEAAQRLEQREGDVRYMTVVQWCVAERSKLLGLYAPEEMRHVAQLAPVSEIVYELPAKQHVPGLSVIGGQRSLPQAPEDESSPEDAGEEIQVSRPRISAGELWGADDDASSRVVKAAS